MSFVALAEFLSGSAVWVIEPSSAVKPVDDQSCFQFTPCHPFMLPRSDDNDMKAIK
jgi:hypothetical protein